MARDLGRYFDDLERRVSQIENDLDRRARGGSLRNAMASFDEYVAMGERATFWGKSVSLYDKEELTAAIGYLIETMRAHNIM